MTLQIGNADQVKRTDKERSEHWENVYSTIGWTESKEEVLNALLISLNNDEINMENHFLRLVHSDGTVENF